MLFSEKVLADEEIRPLILKKHFQINQRNTVKSKKNSLEESIQLKELTDASVHYFICQHEYSVVLLLKNSLTC